MKRFVVVAVWVLMPVMVGAQELPEWSVQGAGALGFIPYPFGNDGCGEAQVAYGGKVGVARRIAFRFDVQLSGTVLQEFDGINCAETLSPLLPGTYVVRRHDRDLFEDPLLTSDVRVRLHAGDVLAANVAAGAGLALPPHNSPYALGALGIEFGRGPRIGINVEYRVFRIPNDWVLVTVGENTHTEQDVGDGVHWSSGGFIALSVSYPLR